MHGFNVVGQNLAYANFIDGKFVESKAKKFTDVHNPVCKRKRQAFLARLTGYVGNRRDRWPCSGEHA